MSKQNNSTKDELADAMQCEVRSMQSGRLLTFSRSWLSAKDMMNKNVLTASVDESMTSAAKKMSEGYASYIIVVDNEKPVGILTETDFLRKTVGREDTFDNIPLSKIMSSPIKNIPEDMSIIETCQFLENNKLKRIAVMAGEKLKGIITQTDVLKILTLYGMWKDVEEIMRTDVATVANTTTATEAAWIMTSRDTSFTIVLENEKVVGIFTERDLVKKIIAAGKDSDQIKVEEVMSYPVKSIAPDCSVLSASKIMENEKIRRLIVMENETLRGVVSQIDIISIVRKKLQRGQAEAYDSLELSENCVYSLDLNGVITYINPAFMKLLKLPHRRELLGKTFLPDHFWVNPSDGTEFLEKIKEKADVSSKDITLKTCEGKTIHVTHFCSFTKDIRGEINAVQGILHDISERKELEDLRQMEKKLLEAHEELEKKVVDLERFNKIAVDRELKMVQLKERIKELEAKLAEKS